MYGVNGKLVEAVICFYNYNKAYMRGNCKLIECLLYVRKGVRLSPYSVTVEKFEYWFYSLTFRR